MTATPKQELEAPPHAPEADEVELLTRDGLHGPSASERRHGTSGPERLHGPSGSEQAPRDEEEEARAGGEAPKRSRKSSASGTTRPKGGGQPNNVRKLRQAAMMSKAELARRAGVSPLTIDRVESGCPCRMDTKRKILEALGLSPSAREQVFGPDIDQG
jgi:DNA-binding XRE family transcriptional regulator